MGFYRKIEDTLMDYYKHNSERILVVNGARQIGKTYIIRNTASECFSNYIEINLREDFDGQKFFSSVQTTDDFYLQLSALYGDRLGSVEDTIIFLDEIQVYPHLLSMLKPLNQENRFRYIASGSLLGLTMRHTFIPMGNVEEVQMYPMDFEEFLMASGVGKEVITYLRDCFENRKEITQGIHDTILKRFKEYLIAGGLPDAVKAFVIEKNVQRVRDIQTETLKFYLDDASQYDQQYNLKVRRVYESLVSYMTNKVKRVIYNRIEGKKQRRISDYQDEFDYLIYSGCTLPAQGVANPIFPLNQTQGKNLMKLYYNDVGILSNLLFKTNILAILNNDAEVNLGSVYETAVAMELAAHGHSLYYFDSKKVGEVDFLVNDYQSLEVLPIEVKSGNDINNFRAIPKLVDSQGNYKINKGCIFSNNKEIKQEGNLYYYPIYMIMFI